MLIKRIKIPKNKLLYFFIGGMVYNNKFSFATGSSNRYPFTTYYINKVKDINKDGIRYRSLFYCKLPLICLQFKDRCECIELDFPDNIKGKDMPFVGLRETEGFYEVIIRHFPEITVKEKKYAWLGISRKRKIRPRKIDLKVNHYRKNSWREAVLQYCKKQKIKKTKIKTGGLMKEVKEALFRSYDNELGTFLQMPWSDSTGFCMDKYSYSLLGFEAKRLNYFQELYEKTGDPYYALWSGKLEKLFLNPDLQVHTKNGFAWYNMTHFDGKKLRGLFYLDIGYAGYPPGQATISFNLAKYLQKNKNVKLEVLLKKNLNYIMKTQNPDGSWNTALPKGKIKRREWKKSEGSTAECVRALLVGYHLFKEERYKEAAIKALEYLDKENPICRNVLRDIGIDEPEAFSAILVIDALLDAYTSFNKEKYLKKAEEYAIHGLTWFYWYGNLKGFFHPISESITPRISPYESLMLVNTYKRLYKKTNNEVWNNFSDQLFAKTVGLKDKNNALPEGIFPNLTGKFCPLPMEQTFATAELLHTCLNYGTYLYKDFEKEKINIEEKEDHFIVENSLKVGKQEFYLKTKNRKLDILFSSPYETKSIIYTRISKFIRKLGILNVGRDFNYLLKGVKNKKVKPKPGKIEKYIEKYNVRKGEKELAIEIKLPLHKIKITIFKAGKLKIDIKILVREHDLMCDKVIINGKDYTLDTNWTNGGLFRKTFDLGV
ncbi:MAG: hypothetical protein JSV92_04775 [archaeon]|nr:MAG: hypothetical protein JSV92_04775 [archaeon]